MNILDRVFARFYPKIISSSEDKWLRESRAALLAAAEGDVVEVGTGTGLNLPHYGPGVASLTLTEMSPYMIESLDDALRKHGRNAKVVRAPAESLPLPDDCADVVVCTLVLCSVDEPQQALAEMRRVLRPGGTLLVIEHVAGSGRLQKIQRWSDPITKTFGRGCHTSRDTRAELGRAGFDISEIRDEWIDSEPKIYAPHIVGPARVA